MHVSHWGLLSRLFLVWAAGCCVAGSAFGQSSLALASSAGSKGAAVPLNLSLNVVGMGPAAFQWKLTYSSTDISSVTVAAGPALTSAGKALACSTATGTIMCMAVGLNSTAIASGVVAVVTA